MNVPQLHASLAPLARLVGTWEGTGAGEYPTIEPFAYREQVTFTPTAKPFLAYRQQTWALSDGRPLHAETGYWRMPEPGVVEVVLAHPTGLTEILEGRVDGSRIRLRSTHVAATATATPVAQVERDVTMGDGTLRYALRMAAAGVPLTHHLAATLTRPTAAA